MGLTEYEADGLKDANGYVFYNINPRFVNIAKKIKEHQDYQSNYVDNPDIQNRDLAYEKIFREVMNQQRRTELELYRMISQDDVFRQAMQDTVKRILH